MYTLEKLHVQVPFADEETCDAEHDQEGRDGPKPIKILHLLAGHLDVHAPHSRNDVHWQDDRAQHCQLAEHIVGLLRTLVHPDVDLRKVVAVRT